MNISCSILWHHNHSVDGIVDSLQVAGRSHHDIHRPVERLLEHRSNLFSWVVNPHVFRKVLLQPRGVAPTTWSKTF